MFEKAKRRLGEELFATLWSWAFAETQGWRRRCPNGLQVHEDLVELNGSDPKAYIFQIGGGQATCWSKPDYVSVDPKHMYSIRRGQYLAFLNDVARKWAPRLRTELVVSMCDGWINHPRIPTFTHHRPTSVTTLLVPGPEFLSEAFYEGRAYRDSFSWEEKSTQAIFTGSTTGMILTRDIVERRGTGRLEAGEYFSRTPDVEFTLPNIVHAADDDALDALQSLPFCGGPRVDWREQFKRKFLISLDGNGAACSRVAIALKSSSALMKYDSDYSLFYFRALLPWCHYIPISHHDDVLAAIALEKERPGAAKSIANEGRRFSSKYLSRQAVEVYTALLLWMYSDCVNPALENKPIWAKNA